MSEIDSHSKTSLGRVFCMGAVTPYATLFYRVTFREKPAWLNKGFIQSSQPSQKISYHFGLAAGLFSLMALMYQVEDVLIKKYILPPSSAPSSAPSNKPIIIDPKPEHLPLPHLHRRPANDQVAILSAMDRHIV